MAPKSRFSFDLQEFIKSKEEKMIFNFEDLKTATLFSNYLYNQKRRKNIGKNLKIFLNKISFEILIVKKVEPKLTLFLNKENQK